MTDTDKMRETFHAFVQGAGGHTLRRADGSYVSSMTELWWKCWKYAHAAGMKQGMECAEQRCINVAEHHQRLAKLSNNEVVCKLRADGATDCADAIRAKIKEMP